MKSPFPCVIDGCVKPRNTKGLCTTHLKRSRLYGDPLLNAAGGQSVGPASDEDRFFAKVNQDGPIARPGLSPCWIWLASVRAADGYGQFWFRNAQNTSHRASYEMFVGAVPVGMSVLHRCDVPTCVRPEHLFAGTQQDNMTDMLEKGRHRPGRTVSRRCKQGHEWPVGSVPGARRCKPCEQTYHRRRRATKKAA